MVGGIGGECEELFFGGGAGDGVVPRRGWVSCLCSWQIGMAWNVSYDDTRAVADVTAEEEATQGIMEGRVKGRRTCPWKVWFGLLCIARILEGLNLVREEEERI